MNSKPKISVVMATFNGEKYISEQLESIINQSKLPDELLICDDKSNDNTINIVKRYITKSPFPIKIIINTSRKGVLKNFENGIKNASGDIIFLSDQDDIWVNSKIEKGVSLLEKNKKAFFFSNSKLVNDKLEPLNNDLFNLNRFNSSKQLKFKNSVKQQLNILFRRNFIPGMTMAFWKDSINYFLPFPENWPHDHWAVIILSTLGYKGVYLNEPLVIYRQHPNQTTGTTYRLSSLKNSFKIKCLQVEAYISKLNELIKQLDSEKQIITLTTPININNLKKSEKILKQNKIKGCILRLSNFDIFNFISSITK